MDSGIVHCTYLGDQGITGYNLEKVMYPKIVFCLKIFLTFTNSVDPDEMQHFYAAFHQGLHCL